METHNIFGYTWRLRAADWGGQIKKDYTLSAGEHVAAQCGASYAASLPTSLRHIRPSAPPRLLWSDVQNPARCDQRGPESDPRTASLWARWSWEATAAGS